MQACCVLVPSGGLAVRRSGCPAFLRSDFKAALLSGVPPAGVKCNSLIISKIKKEDSEIFGVFFYVLPHYQHFTFYARVSRPKKSLPKKVNYYGC